MAGRGGRARCRGPTASPPRTLESPLWRDSVMYVEQYGDFWNYALRAAGYLHKFCVGAAQLDRFGNANNSVIGDDYHRPKVRLPGHRRPRPTWARSARRSTTGTPTTTRARSSSGSTSSRAPGYLGGGDERERLGLTGGPQLVVTNLAVLDFDPASKRMRHPVGPPRRRVEQVQAATGFELLLADEVTETPKPTPEQVRAPPRGDRPGRDAQARGRGEGAVNGRARGRKA